MTRQHVKKSCPCATTASPAYPPRGRTGAVCRAISGTPAPSPGPPRPDSLRRSSWQLPSSGEWERHTRSAYSPSWRCCGPGGASDGAGDLLLVAPIFALAAGLLLLARGLADIRSSVEVSGTVLRLRNHGSEKEPRYCVAVDEGSATVHAWVVRPEATRGHLALGQRSGGACAQEGRGFARSRPAKRRVPRTRRRGCGDRRLSGESHLRPRAA